MTTCLSVCVKTGVSVANELRHQCLSYSRRRASTLTQGLPSQRETPNARATATDDQRDLLVDILSANATKRDAKQYLARFKGPKSTSKAQSDESRPKDDQKARHKTCPSVNLGSLYSGVRAIDDSPQFIRSKQAEQQAPSTDYLHVSLIALRGSEDMTDETIQGLALTIAQLVKLDMRVVLVLAPDEISRDQYQLRHHDLQQQAERLVEALNKHSRHGARAISQAIVSNVEHEQEDGGVALLSPKVIRHPLAKGMVTVIPSIAYNTQSRPTIIPLRETMALLTEEFASNHESSGAEEKTSLDRIIFVDPRGGIPSRARRDGAHLFVNLRQEYDDILHELQDARHQSSSKDQDSFDGHIDNLHIARTTLALLPPSSSALIITPEEAASSSVRKHDDAYTIGAGTRRKRNTLIHNLLTNKPLVSSSLPLARFAPGTSSTSDTGITLAPTATLLKKGMPLEFVPGNTQDELAWSFPSSGRTSLDLERDERVDLPRLVHLINDSFRRQLDVRAYLDRVAGRIAGLIIAGDYEGCAILTWESPPSSDGRHPTRVVPYLDKFAVLQSSQGSAGVADIVFQAMVRTCFPAGVCWRSRSNNPVNKWYFERAAGSWKLPDTQWTMFWTGDGVVEDRSTWDDYVAVCRGIVPTWLEGKKPD